VKDPKWDLSRKIYKDQRLFLLTPPSSAKSKSNMKNSTSLMLNQTKQSYNLRLMKQREKCCLKTGLKL